MSGFFMNQVCPAFLFLTVQTIVASYLLANEHLDQT
ncbi:hypothetical protein EMIT093MI4_110203 [Pseudomonas sp. IT-93MI4]